jgi:hypothetical protein
MPDPFSLSGGTKLPDCLFSRSGFCQLKILTSLFFTYYGGSVILKQKTENKGMIS